MQGFMKLTVDGSEVAGYNSFAQVGGEDLSDYIQIESFDFGLAREGSSATERKHLTVTKHMDQATPLIVQALSRNSVCEVNLKIFEPSDDGTTQLSLEVTATQGKVVSSVCDGISGDTPPTESVAFSYGTLRLQHHQASVEVELDFSASV